jgi:hypothetical protein
MKKTEKIAMWLLPRLLNYLNSKEIYANIWYKYYMPLMCSTPWRIINASKNTK